jgi:hypothetical protein
MSVPYDRHTFKKYILRALGDPVISINVSDSQIEDRIDEALSFFCDNHYNGSVHTYYKYQIGENDIINGIDMPDEIVGVSRIFNIGSNISSSSGMWNVTYQYVLNNINELTSGEISNYVMNMQHLSLIEEWLVGQPLIRYNRHINKLMIDKSNISVGTYIIIECYVMLKSEYSRLWSDRWLQNYAKVLVKEQWGINITKFSGMQLMGGVQFNGDQILAQAREEREKMEQDAISSLQPLIFNFIG